MNRERIKMLLDGAVKEGLDAIPVVLDGPLPKNFPRGELLCVNSAGQRVYRMRLSAIRRWLRKSAS